MAQETAQQVPLLVPAALAMGSRDVDAQAAQEEAMRALGEGATALRAAVLACSSIRLAGHVEAACMSSDGKFGAVAALHDVPQPAKVAEVVHTTPHNLLAGRGAMALARALGFHDPPTRAVAAGSEPRPPDAHPSSSAMDNPAQDRWLAVAVRDHVGLAACIVGQAPPGRPGLLGAAPLLGCGLHVTPVRAVAMGGNQAAIVARQWARSLHQDLEADRATWSDVPPDVGALVLERQRGLARVGGSFASAGGVR